MLGGGGPATATVTVQMPAEEATGQGQEAAAPERQLIRFLHFLALVERTGNALGTLAFTWATVVLLGGYPTVLSNIDNVLIGDFEAATVIFFLEATRMFSSRSNRLDYQLFFGTRGAFRPLAWNGLVVIVCFSDILMFMLIWNLNHWAPTELWRLSILALAACQCLCPRLHVRSPLRRALLLWSPMVAVILLGPSVPYSCDDCDDYAEPHKFTLRSSVTKWIVYLVLVVSVLLLTISRMQLPSIIKLADSAVGRKLASWRKTAVNLCMLVAAAMLAVTSGGLKIVIILFQAYGLVIVSFGNLQIPAALLRVGLAAMHLAEPTGDYGDGSDTTNLVPSLAIFYVMVLGQGILYIVPCILQVFSFILRRSLVRRAGLRGEWGVESVDLYYLYAFEKHMEGGILSAKNISIITFAVESLKSDTPKMQLLGVQMLHSFLKKEPLKAMTISKLTDSTKTVTSLLKMLGWASQGHRDTRYFAAKVLAELAVSLRVLPIPGAVRQIASLLSTIHPMEIQSPLLHNYRKEAKQEAQIQDTDCLTPELKFWKQMIVYCLIPVEEPSKLVDKQDSYIHKCWKNITKCYSVPEEDQSADHDLLPVLGMLSLERLADFDTENCMEISRATGLISMIIEFTSNRTDLVTNINQTHQEMLKGSSLKVLRRLTSTEGRSGVKLRHEISEHPFLLRNLAQILDDDDGSSQELSELTVEILRNLAVDETTREEIGRFRVIIRSLMRAFLSRAVTDSDELLQIVAGQALAVLAMESPNNCLAMSEEPGYVFINELTTMIHVDRYWYIAASLLRNMCVHARSKLGKADLKELSHILPKVLDGIMNRDGAELEVLVGLSSQICIAIPGDFARELEHGQNKERFIKRLVNSLNANMGTVAHCPGVRRAVVEQAVCMMEFDPAYTECFIKCGMMEALVMVEHQHFRAENYRYFSGDVGLMEHSVPLSVLVARAKELMRGNGLYWDS